LALSLKLDTTRYTLFITTLNNHTFGPQLQLSTTARQSILNRTPGAWFLGSMPAIQWYKIHPQRDIIHEVTGLNGVGCWRSQTSMADTSTTTAPILNPFAGDCWARRQLPNGIRYISVASKPMQSLSSVQGVSGIKLVILYSIADISTTDGRILTLFAGGCWA